MTIFEPDALMVEWERDGFRVETYETGVVDGTHTMVAYRLYDERFEAQSVVVDRPSRCVGEPIFEGTDLGIPSHVAIDSEETVAHLLSFLSLRPGDTDHDYFDAYSERQWRWVEQRAEDLSLAALDAFGADA